MKRGRRVGTFHIDVDRVVHIAATRWGVDGKMFCEQDRGETSDHMFSFGAELNPSEYHPNCIMCVVIHGSQIP